ncbi:DNA-processing protein DprA [Bacillus toyonensis]|uniref:DNA-processing protein DprA n=1 Tax=Bacillus toyonensis TaxID=155322 RepID=UPI002E2051BE|nr:DNA-processing protein DprA [Bacillus toyonensis]MED2737352.1 DNA-processing protein DprA [Bacillus toyonensis]
MNIVGTLTTWEEDDLVAIIGPRNATERECLLAYELGKKTAAKGKVVVSGLAEGIDTYAHRGALDAGGKTIAVLGLSKDEPIYPEINKQLSERIKENGALIFPFGLSSEEFDKVNSIQMKRRIRTKGRRLIERNVLLAYISKVIIAITDQYIEGGTRWALNYGEKFDKEVFQMNSKAKFIVPRFAEDELDWNPEIQLGEIDTLLKG